MSDKYTKNENLKQVADIIEAHKQSNNSNNSFIPFITVQKVIEETQIEKVVGEFVKLKRKGSNLIGLCPFHEEKTPSFSVSPTKNIFKCFGCGKGGNSLHFLMQLKSFTFSESVRYLASVANIMIENTKPDPDAAAKHEKREQLIAFNEFALKFYQSFLKDTALDYAKTRMSTESINFFEIGYAPDNNALASAARNSGYKEEFLIETQLVRLSDKTNHLYDFFQNRLIFPIRDTAGRLISFTGRVLPETSEKQSKYINLAESELYNKSKVLYGANMALREIKQQDRAIIVEGNTDVIRMHELGFPATIAPMGTALTNDQLNLISRFTKNLMMVYDGDIAGRKAALKNSKLAIEKGFFVQVVFMPEGKDPADFTNIDEAEKFFNEEKKDFIAWYSADLSQKAGEDPSLKNEAVKELAGLLINYDKTTRDIFIDGITGKGKLKAKLLRDRITEIDKNNIVETSHKTEQPLPPGVDAVELARWGFYEYCNKYYFQTKSGEEQLSNFVMKPIFHIESTYDSKRIFELKNAFGYKVVVNLDMQEMTSLQAFQKNVEGKGNFLFWGAPQQFNKLKQKLYQETNTCSEIAVLGWQKEGFWAWANGIITKDGFIEIDEYGVIKYNEKHYFIPAFSNIYINDKSIFIDQRKFKFISREITLSDWSKKMVQVFDDNGKIGMAFWVAAVFRDHLVHIFKNFPILNLFGPKGTGKSQMAVSLCSMFGNSQTPVNIHNVTKAGMGEHMQQFSNSIAWIDEYKNSLDIEKIEGLKSVFDSIGRSRMNMDRGKKKEVTEVNSALILTGQEMPTADIALYSRVIFLLFNQDTFTDEEKQTFHELKEMESEGLSHITSQLIGIRDYFVKEFFDIYQDTLSDFTAHFAETPIQDRIMLNVVAVVAAWRTAAGVINEFPFHYTDLREIAYKTIETQNSQINQSDEIGQFWAIMESLYDENLIIDKWHFRIDFEDNIKTTLGEKPIRPARDILKFKYNLMYSLYSQQARKQGLKPMPSDTLHYYLKNHKFFLGIQNSCVFTETKYDTEMRDIIRKKQTTSAFCFDYKKLSIDLVRTNELVYVPGVDSITKQSDSIPIDNYKQKNIDDIDENFPF